MAVGRVLLLCVSAVLIIAAPASALTFNFVSGTAHVTAQVVGDVGFLVDTDINLDGTFLDFETAPVGVPDFQISLEPTGPIAMSGSYGGYDMFTIEDAILYPGIGYSSSGSPFSATEYDVTLLNLQVDAHYGASDSGAINPPVSGVPISFKNDALLGTVNTDLIEFEIIGITLGVLPGALVGETNDLIVKADITFVGQIVPEPTTGALLGLGLSMLAASRARFSRTRPRR